MMNEYRQTLEQVNSLQKTENGALGYSTTGQKLVDLNFTVPSNHNNVSVEDIQKFVQALNEDLVSTVKWMFYLRDIREGLGERDSFVNLFMALYAYDEEIATKVLPLIPEYGRWKDVIDIFARTTDGSTMANAIAELITKQLVEDCVHVSTGKSVSLLAKWMPSVNASKRSRKVAARLCKHLELTFEDYRHTLAALRRYTDVTEVKTCSGEWNEIDYNKVSSNANARYLKAFMKHDQERRKKYLAALAKPLVTGAVMHASALYPHEVYAKYSPAGLYDYSHMNVAVDEGIEALWANLKDIPTSGNTMVVVDGSGSMEGHHINGSNIMAIDVARSLGVFFSERCTGEFKDKVIEFSATPRYIDLSGCKTLADKYNTLSNYDDCSNTNLEKVFDLLLMTAMRNHLSQEELPERLLIVSDMEFDHSGEFSSQFRRRPHEEVMARYQTLFETIKERWDTAGYKMPQIVFWNVNSRTNTIPVTANEVGVTLVSGYSVNNIKMILVNKADAWEALKSVLDSERYDVVETAING